MNEMSCFNPAQIRTVRQAYEGAAALVSQYYGVAPREWRQMPYEVKKAKSKRRRAPS